MMVWIALGGFFYNPPPELLPLTTDRCLINSTSTTISLEANQNLGITNKNEGFVTEIPLDTSTFFNSTSSLNESDEM